MDLNTTMIIMKIARIEIVFTVFKSTSVTSWRSLVRGASPITIDSGLYPFTIFWISSIWLFTSSVAVLYLEQINSISYSSLSSIFFRLLGIMVSGNAAPTKESIPSAHFTPSTSLIWSSISVFSFDVRPFFNNTIWTLFISKVSWSLAFATLLSSVEGSDLSIL